MRRILSRLGEDATFTHAGGSPVSVRGVFVAPHNAIAFAGLEVSSTLPRFAAMSADLASVAVDDTLAIGADSYTVRDVQPDRTSGVTVLELEE